MPYSLVSAPILGFDLTRLPHGAEVADILLAALRLDAAGIALVADSVRRTDRPDRPRIEPPPSMSAQLRGLGGPANTLLADPETVVRSLERGMIGSADALHRLLRDDVLDWTWHTDGSLRVQQPAAARAAATISDALFAAYCAGSIPHTQQRRLSAAWQRVAERLPDANDDLGPFADDVRATLAQVRALTARQRRALRERSGRAGGADRGFAGWAAAAHDAGWAAHLSRRVRSAAAAQLLAVRAFGDAGFTASDSAYGTWNIISGAVQADVVSDLLADDSRAVLRDRWDLAVDS